MTNHVQIMNLTRVPQHHGKEVFPPGEWRAVPYETAVRLADQLDYRADSPELLNDFKFTDENGLTLGWSSPFHFADGYGSVAQEIAAGLLEMGINLSIYPRDYTPAHKQFGALPLEEWHKQAWVPSAIVDKLSGPQDRAFYGFNMTFPKEVHRHPFVRGIGLTMFETTLPPRPWLEPMNRCRRIVTPCRQNKEAFENIGVRVPIDVVNLGVNPDAWPYVDRSKMGGQPFTFLIAGGLTYRKNPMAAAWAFVRAFPSQGDVRLILKTRGPQTAGGFHEWQKRLPRDTRITIVHEESTPAQMHNWFVAADAFVFPSRGEGFGLPPLQAMATGLPTIVSDNSGMSEYANPKYCYPIPCKEVRVPKEEGYPPDWGDVGCWWEPQIDWIVEEMRAIHADRSKAFRKGKAAAKWVRERWTIDRICDGLLDVVMQDAGEDGLI